MLRSMLRPDGDLRCLLTALCLVALVATFAVPVLAPGLAAYNADHGHLTLDGRLPANHVHPWDSEGGVASTTASGERSDIVFTLANDGEPASGWASATLVPAPLAIASPAFLLALEVPQIATPEALASPPLSPPPRI